jgi:hypothetical protein
MEHNIHACTEAFIFTFAVTVISEQTRLIFYIVHTMYVPIQLDVCQQPPCTHNSITTDTQVFIYPNISNASQRHHRGHLFKNTRTPLKTLEVLKHSAVFQLSAKDYFQQLKNCVECF